MARSFFQRAAKLAGIGENQQKNAAARASDLPEVKQRPIDRNPVEPPKLLSIYDDTDVCRVLGLRKRIVVAARTEKTRGQDWAVEGEHVGMTGDWILRKNPSVDLKNLQPIKNRDGIVTVRIIGRATNNQVLIGQKVCDGRKVMVRVRDGRDHFRGDEMDTRLIGTMHQFIESLTPEKY